MKDKLETYHSFKRFFYINKLRSEEDFAKTSIFMDVYNMDEYLFTQQISDTQIGISPKNGDQNPFTGHDYVFYTLKDAKAYIKKEFLVSEIKLSVTSKLAESHAEIEKRTVFGKPVKELGINVR